MYKRQAPYKRLREEEQYHRQYRQHRIHGFLDSVSPRLIFFYVLIDLFIFIVCIFPAVFFPVQPHKDGKQDGEQRTGCLLYTSVPR